MNELDFSGKQVLAVGGSSGIGNGIAQAFRAKGARVQVCGTRIKAADDSPAGDSHLEGLDYAQLDVSDAQAMEFQAVVQPARCAGAGAGRSSSEPDRISSVSSPTISKE
jgi:NAD(P)-dependent dehydrogenase (short-subunit alcohol dehydrogenase family)